MREAFLQAHPLCRPCEEEGRTTPATEVDHIVPHRGDPARFWDMENLQPICHACHVRKTRAEIAARQQQKTGVGGAKI